MSTQASAASESTFEAVLYTVEALAARAQSPELVKLSHRVSSLLGDWESLHAERRRVRRSVVRANAQAHAADAGLDAAIHAFARDVLTAVEGDAGHDLYKRFFFEPHDDIIAMGLDAELPVVTLLVHTLEHAEDLPARLKAHLEPLRAGLRLGNGALGDRSESYADLGRLAAREIAWAETAKSTLASVRRTLARIAGEQGHTNAWVESFFS